MQMSLAVLAPVAAVIALIVAFANYRSRVDKLRRADKMDHRP